MKSTINKIIVREFEFPCLMVSIYMKMIVLFFEPGKGVVISNIEKYGYGVGTYANDWNMANFKPFSGSITLEND